MVKILTNYMLHKSNDVQDGWKINAQTNCENVYA